MEIGPAPKIQLKFWLIAALSSTIEIIVGRLFAGHVLQLNTAAVIVEEESSSSNIRSSPIC